MAKNLLDQARVVNDGKASVKQVSVLTIDTFQQRPDGEAEWLEAAGPCREAEMGQ
jgi:hypothetical protein